MPYSRFRVKPATCFILTMEITEEQIEKAVNNTIEDMKNIFRYAPAQPGTKKNTLFVPEKKMGTIRYLLIKNITSQAKPNE